MRVRIAPGAPELQPPKMGGFVFYSEYTVFFSFSCVLCMIKKIIELKTMDVLLIHEKKYIHACCLITKIPQSGDFTKDPTYTFQMPPRHSQHLLTNLSN